MTQHFDLEILVELLAPITQAETDAAIKSIHPWKALGPDGFPISFF